MLRDTGLTMLVWAIAEALALTLREGAGGYSHFSAVHAESTGRLLPAQPGLQFLALPAPTPPAAVKLSVARLRSGVKIHIPNGSATISANIAAMIGGKSLSPSSRPSP